MTYNHIHTKTELLSPGAWPQIASFITARGKSEKDKGHRKGKD